MADILCLGEPLVEFVRQDDGTYRQGFGGDTSNAAIAAARQGASVGYLTALGRDRFGDAVMELWASEGVDAAAVRRAPDAPTGIYFVDPDPEGRFFTYYRAGSAASRYGPDDLDAHALRKARVLHLSGITLAVSARLRAAALRAAEIVRDAGGTVSLDTNLRLKLWDAEEARRITDQTMELAGIAITSIDDSAHLTGLDDPDQIIAHYQGMGPEIVLVTLGAEGARLGFGPERASIPPAHSEPIDSTGAGDSFSGAFLAYWRETGDPVEAATRAAKVAAGTVSGLGAVAPIPRRGQI